MNKISQDKINQEKIEYLKEVDRIKKIDEEERIRKRNDFKRENLNKFSNKELSKINETKRKVNETRVKKIEQKNSRSDVRGYLYEDFGGMDRYLDKKAEEMRKLELELWEYDNGYEVEEKEVKKKVHRKIIID